MIVPALVSTQDCLLQVSVFVKLVAIYFRVSNKNSNRHFYMLFAQDVVVFGTLDCYLPIITDLIYSIAVRNERCL